MTSGLFTGTLTLWARSLKGDRWLMLGCGVALAVLYWAQAWSIDRLYPGEGELARMAAAMERNQAMIALAGPARSLDTVGGQVTWQASAFGAVLLGLVVMVVVTRHTRAEEESGRDDLVRSAVVGRFAPPAAAVLTALVVSVFSGALVTLSLVTYPLEVADSAALGVGLVLCGLCFTGTTLVAAQLVSSTRAARGIAGAVIARRRRRLGARAVLALADRLVPGDAPLLRAALVAGAAAARCRGGQPRAGRRPARAP